MKKMLKKIKLFLLIKICMPLLVIIFICYMVSAIIMSIFHQQYSQIEQIVYATCEESSLDASEVVSTRVGKTISSEKIPQLKQAFSSLSNWNGSVKFPVTNGTISSDFNVVRGDGDAHNGTDFASTGIAYAIVDGIVIANSYDDSRGYYVALGFKDKKGKAMTLLYQHLKSTPHAYIGDLIRSGSPIGTIGNSGTGTGVHLHTEVEIADMSVGYPRWVGTYPTNATVMFDTLKYFGLPRTFSGLVGSVTNSTINNSQKCQSTGSTLLVGKDNAEKLYNFFTTKGYSPEAAVAIIGNFAIESGVDPTKKQIGGGPGRGLAQWGEGADGGRFNKLVAFCSQNNKSDPDPYSLGCQAEFVIHELDTSYKAVADLLKIAGSVESYTKDFQNIYEAPADRVGSLQKRIDAAKLYLAAFKK